MPHGLMLVTGPTGSGKSTTLYACLNLLNEPDTNICTVEDPVEYKFKGMNQVQVKTQVGPDVRQRLAGVSAARPGRDHGRRGPRPGNGPDLPACRPDRPLRALHDPHQRLAFRRQPRLQDMGIEPFLLASTLRVLEAQRLIRRLCKECKEPYDRDAETAKRYGLEPGEPLFRPKGCDHCRGAGYRGRVGIFEVIRITPNMAKLIQQRTPLPEMREAARDEGMKLLIDSGIVKARLGVTSLEAVLSVAMSDEE